MAKAVDGAAAFELYYQNLYGNRWPGLKAALLAPKEQTAITLTNPPYYLDKASLQVVKALQIDKDMQVLDMCAAPGGKSLAIAQALQGTGLLMANELQSDRFFRLKRVINNLSENYHQNIKLTKYDATRLNFFINNTHFDRILLDAPCSSEAHVLADNKYLQQWKPSRSKNLAIKQLAMLCSALELCQAGGLIAYSTCALSPTENDEVIEKFLKKRAGRLKVIHIPLVGEATSYGQIILPDNPNTAGQGPMYFCIIKKIISD
ncbi:MAG: RsmB/NOP family class I SAM-dependent RNA methyltransferase [Spirochaetaceae bacterium]|nr:RsmB/NOP family class I SAM-dependent RNA methyltransferase [Spirochaetaceae bacterium]